MLVPLRLSYSLQTQMLPSPANVKVLPGQTFTINITVENVDNLNAWQVALKYNGSIINCTTARIPDDDVFAGKTIVPGSADLDQPTVDGFNYTLYGSTLFADSVNVPQGILCSFKRAR